MTCGCRSSGGPLRSAPGTGQRAVADQPPRPCAGRGVRSRGRLLRRVRPVRRVDGRPVDGARRGAPPGDRSGTVQPADGRSAPRDPVRRKLPQRPQTHPRGPAANGARVGGLRPGLDARSNRPAVCGRRGDPEPRARRVLRRSVDRAQRSLAGHGTRRVPFDRLYDAAAAGGFVISDEVEGLDGEFDGGIVMYRDAGNSARTSTISLRTRGTAGCAERARQAVLARHTFEQRARTIIDTIDPLLSERPEAI